MSITPLPPAPETSDSPSEFNSKAFAWVNSLDGFTTELNAELPTINEAIPAAQAAVASANYKGEWSTLTGALAIPASVSHNDAVWILTENLADVTAAEPGVDARWLNVSAGSGLPIGALQYFAGATTTTYPGEEWLLADGSIVTQTAYSELFDRVGLIGDEVGATWATVSSGTTSIIFGIAYDNNVFVYVGVGGVLATSTDAITWTARTSGTTSNLFEIAYDDNVFVYAGDGVLATSTDAITWTARTSGTASSIFNLAYGDGLFVYAGDGGVLATSTDAITWTARTSGTATTIFKLAYGDGIFVYVANDGVLATSTDAITWTARTSGTAGQIRALLYADGIFVYGAQDGILATSTDAITWTARTSGTTSQMFDFGFGDNKLIYVGSGGIVGYSTEYGYDPNTEFALPTATVTSIVDSQNNLFIKAE